MPLPSSIIHHSFGPDPLNVISQDVERFSHPPVVFFFFAKLVFLLARLYFSVASKPA
jgi:hypothetical protein